MSAAATFCATCGTSVAVAEPDSAAFPEPDLESAAPIESWEVDPFQPEHEESPKELPVAAGSVEWLVATFKTADPAQTAGNIAIGVAIVALVDLLTGALAGTPTSYLPQQIVGSLVWSAFLFASLRLWRVRASAARALVTVAMSQLLMFLPSLLIGFLFMTVAMATYSVGPGYNSDPFAAFRLFSLVLIAVTVLVTTAVTKAVAVTSFGRALAVVVTAWLAVTASTVLLASSMGLRIF